MLAARILYRYITREILSYTAIALLLFGLIILVGDVGRSLAPLISLGISWGDVGRLAVLTLPMILSYAIPVAFTFGMLAAYGRLSSDSEVTAMCASGLHLGHLLVPSLSLGLVFCLVIGLFTVYVEAPSRAESRRIVLDIALREFSIVPGRFQTLENRVVFVDRKDEDGTLHDIFLSDPSNEDRPLEIFAETGKLSINQQAGELQFQLHDGGIHLPQGADNPNSYRLIAFEQMPYTIPVADLVAGEYRSWRPRDQTTKTLREILSVYTSQDAPLPESLEHIRKKPPVLFEMEYARRYALPVASLLFPLLCVPLGLRRHRDASSSGTLYCLAIVFSYYILISFGVSMGERNLVPALVAVWLPNFLLGLTGLFLVRFTNRSEF